MQAQAITPTLERLETGAGKPVIIAVSMFFAAVSVILKFMTTRLPTLYELLLLIVTPVAAVPVIAMGVEDLSQPVIALL